MSYFAEQNHIEYDAWFDENIDPVDLVNYSDEKEFSDSVHFKFHKMSTRNLTIGSSDNFHWLVKDYHSIDSYESYAEYVPSLSLSALANTISSTTFLIM